MPANKEHIKHAKLARSGMGEWGRVELALMGAPCNVIRDMAERIIERLSSSWKIAWVDADHDPAEPLPTGHGSINFLDKISFTRIASATKLSSFQKHALFNHCDAVWVNGNHFPAKQQILFIDPAKSTSSKLDLLTDLRLVLLKNADTEIPSYLQALVEAVPVLLRDDINGIVAFVAAMMLEQRPPLNGLVLAGGQSLRMGTDKGGLNYHGLPQREHVSGLLTLLCEDVFLSSGPGPEGEKQASIIEDRFVGIGPMGGLLSALQHNPLAAWLVVACDLPHLDRATLEYLVSNRNPSRLATAFKSPGNGLPEPLIAIWEPRAYPVLLQALGEGVSCPRKVLAAADIELLDAPDPIALQNVNDPEEYSQAQQQINNIPNDKL